jgi:hypothetical protein
LSIVIPPVVRIALKRSDNEIAVVKLYDNLVSVRRGVLPQSGQTDEVRRHSSAAAGRTTRLVVVWASCESVIEA